MEGASVEVGGKRAGSEALLFATPVLDSANMPGTKQAEASDFGQRLASLEASVKHFKWVTHWLLITWLGVVSAFVAYQYFGKVSQTEQQVGILTARVEDSWKRMDALESRQRNLEEQQQKFLADFLQRLLRMSGAVKPSELQLRLRTAQSVFLAARSSGIVSNPHVLAALGSQLDEISARNPEVAALAWQTFMAALDYKSFLNLAVNPVSLPPNSTKGTCIRIEPGTYIQARIENSLIANCAQALTVRLG